jgi:hypothetical protein
VATAFRLPLDRHMDASTRFVATALACALFSAGCATQNVDATWADPQFTGRSLIGAKVFVVCQASDLAVRRVCFDQMASELVAFGATPVQGPDPGDSISNAEPATDSFIAAARSAGATAILRARLLQDATAVVDSGPQFGIGIGGFGGSWGRGGGVGVGVQVPIGNKPPPSSGYTANGAFTDVQTGRLMWTAKASTGPSQDVNAQVGTLAKRVLQAAQKSGLF